MVNHCPAGTGPAVAEVRRLAVAVNHSPHRHGAGGGGGARGLACSGQSLPHRHGAGGGVSTERKLDNSVVSNTSRFARPSPEGAVSRTRVTRSRSGRSPARRPGCDSCSLHVESAPWQWHPFIDFHEGEKIDKEALKALVAPP